MFQENGRAGTVIVGATPVPALAIEAAGQSFHEGAYFRGVVGLVQLSEVQSQLPLLRDQVIFEFFDQN